MHHVAVEPTENNISNFAESLWVNASRLDCMCLLQRYSIAVYVIWDIPLINYRKTLLHMKLID